MPALPSNAKLVMSVSESVAAPEWDNFLEGTHLGQFQQSSLWASYKIFEGWTPLRYIFSAGSGIAGGFQILCKETRFGQLGYLSKGPVFPDASKDALEHIIVQLVQSIRDKKLTALIVQPPDECNQFPDILNRCGFLDGKPLGVIDATMFIPMDRDFTAVEGMLDRNTRKKIRQAEKRGISIREGNVADLATFFELMTNSCRRQEDDRPNPSSVFLLQQLWEKFYPAGRCRLTFAVHEGTVLAGLFCLIFGNRVTFWKKGWSGERADLRPNECLYADAISCTYRNDFSLCDFVGMDRDIAGRLLTGKPLSKTQEQSRDMFNLRFGGVPKLLPKAMIYFRSKAIGQAYAALNKVKAFRSIIKSFSP